MSVRVLYKKVPKERRLCHHCGKPVLSNIDLLDGEIWHHGCINQAGLHPTHRCRDCYSLLSADNIVRTDFGDGTISKTCGLCGSSSLISLKPPHIPQKIGNM